MDYLAAARTEPSKTVIPKGMLRSFLAVLGEPPKEVVDRLDKVGYGFSLDQYKKPWEHCTHRSPTVSACSTEFECMIKAIDKWPSHLYLVDREGYLYIDRDILEGICKKLTAEDWDAHQDDEVHTFLKPCPFYGKMYGDVFVPDELLVWKDVKIFVDQVIMSIPEIRQWPHPHVKPTSFYTGELFRRVLDLLKTQPYKLIAFNEFAERFFEKFPASHGALCFRSIGGRVHPESIFIHISMTLWAIKIERKVRVY